MANNNVPDHLYERLFQPWTLPESEWPLCKEDWARVNAITALPWEGCIVDVGAGDGTLAAMLCSRHPQVERVDCVEPDHRQRSLIVDRWLNRKWPMACAERITQYSRLPWDAALCCEVLEHLTPDVGLRLLRDIHKRLDGMLCVTVPIEGGTRAVYPGHISSFSQADLRALIAQAGFTKADLNWIPSDGGWTGEPPVWLMVTARA